MLPSGALHSASKRKEGESDERREKRRDTKDMRGEREIYFSVPEIGRNITAVIRKNKHMMPVFRTDFKTAGIRDICDSEIMLATIVFIASLF